MQAFVNVNPATHVADALRGLMNNDINVPSLLIVLGMTVLITAIFPPIALRIYNRIS